MTPVPTSLWERIERARVGPVGCRGRRLADGGSQVCWATVIEGARQSDVMPSSHAASGHGWLTISRAEHRGQQTTSVGAEEAQSSNS